MDKKRAYMLRVRMSAAEREILEERARELGVSASDLVRMLVSRGRLEDEPRKGRKK